MTRKFPRARLTETLGEVLASLVENLAAYDSVHYTYVVDDAGVLQGVLSLKDLHRAPEKTPVRDLVRGQMLRTERPTAHQERAAYLALRYNIKAVPVVDQHRVLLGVIPSRVILSILHKEAHEDLLGMVGVRHPEAVRENVLTLPILRSFLHRTPWLLLGLLGGMLSAHIIGIFETTLTSHLVLASFIPLVVYMSDAVGTQMEAFLIRDLAVEHDLPFRRYVLRQFLVVLLLAATISAFLFFLTFVFARDRAVASVLGIALFLAITSSVFTGLLIPYGFSKLKLDPADASGPVATILQDVLSVTIYFAVATALL